jgi:hypothetical protein
MYVYLCADARSSTHKSTSVKMYREPSSSSSESIECSYLTPTVNTEISAEEKNFFFNFNNLLFYSLNFF